MVRDARQSFIDRRPYEVDLPFYQLPTQYALLLIRTNLPVERKRVPWSWRRIGLRAMDRS